jgi:hypothetical protein
MTSPDTRWSSLRWRIALAIVGRAMWIAPAGTARDRWGDYTRAWSKECRDAWAQRYPNGGD